MERVNSVSKKTNFEKVVQFNKSFGVPISDTPLKNVVVENPALTKLRLDLILEETQELADAVRENDFVEIVDALADILYVVYGAGASFGVDLDRAFDIVHDSNMTKLCKTEEIARQTVESYRVKYEAGTSPYDSPAYRRSDDGVNWVVYNDSTGKVLKSIHYTPADFSEILD
jgi:predicted HAD superfamily Cof-like phosphohydrolase